MRHIRMLYPAAPGLLLALALCTSAAGSADKIPVTTGSKEALAEFTGGRALFDNLRVTDSHAYFQRAVEKDPQFALAHLYLAQSAPTAKAFFAALGKADETASHASRGEQLQIRAFKAASYADPSTAQKLYTELVSAFPDDERAQTLLGTSYFGQQEYAQAAEHLKKATDLAPDFAPAYNQLGYVYRFLGKYDDAETTFKKYTELLPTDPNPFDSYAELLLKMGRFDESIAQYKKALAVDPAFNNSFIGIAACLMYQNRHDEAFAELQGAYDRARNDGERRFALFARGVVYQDEGKPDLALKEIEKEHALAEKINDVASMSADNALMANILLHDGKADEALAHFTTSHALIQKSSLAKEVKENSELLHHYNVARVYIAKGDIAGAKTEAEKFRKGAEAAKNKNQIRLAHELAGMIAFHQKDFGRSIDELTQANQQDPNILYHLALAYQGSGKAEEAKKYAGRAAKDNVLPLMNYAYVRMKAESLLSAL
ncbi:MAG TPA: tetratricopeptide repeat protein [Bacteroidota bacterium]|nr:tetratricopeptide repeat protein [Bacteroidota bacterium]